VAAALVAIVMAHYVVVAVQSTIAADQHTQTLVAIGTLALLVLGGLAHNIYRLGRLSEKVDRLGADVEWIIGPYQRRERES
jgi:hypothetical protein